MQISAIFIAVVVLMVVLIGFVAVVIRGLSVAAGIRIRADMVRLLQSFDSLVEKKTREVQALQAEAEELEKRKAALSEPESAAVQETAAPAPAGAAVSVPAAANYRTASFCDSYSAIKKGFYMTDAEKVEVIRSVTENAQGGQRGEAAAHLRAELSFELMFRLSQMSAQQQLELLDASLNDADWTLLRDYCEQLQGKDFDVTGFCDWLDGISVLEAGSVTVLDGGKMSVPDGGAICEGVRLIAGNKLYDYSIGEREIG